MDCGPRSPTSEKSIALTLEESRDSARGDVHRQRGAARGAAYRLDGVQRREAAHDPAEDDVLAVEVRLRPEEQEELRPIGVLARVGHGKHALTIVSMK